MTYEIPPELTEPQRRMLIRVFIKKTTLEVKTRPQAITWLEKYERPIADHLIEKGYLRPSPMSNSRMDLMFVSGLVLTHKGAVSVARLLVGIITVKLAAAKALAEKDLEVETP